MFLCGCITDHTERVVDTDPSGWMPGDTVWVTIGNVDSLSLRNISVILRGEAGLLPEKVDIDIITVRPDSAVFSESFTLDTSHGRTRNNYTESTIPYRYSNRLEYKGEYRFGFLPAVKYQGITAIGIKLD